MRPAFLLSVWWIFQVGLLNLFATQTSGQIEEPNEDNDDLHPVNFFLTSIDEQTVREKLICRGWPCPRFRVKKDHSPYVQEREYKSFDIVTATTYGCGNFSAGLLQGYLALFRYRKGNNTENRQVKMAVPVVVEITQEEKGQCKDKYKVYVFANSTEAGLDGLPQPIEENVKLEKIQYLDVFVRTFSKYFDQPEPELAKLQSDVHNLNLCFNDSRYMVAMYDPPWKKNGRRNEIWIDAKEC